VSRRAAGESAADRHELLVAYASLAALAGVALGVIALVVQRGRDAPFEVVLLAVGALALGFGRQALQRAVPPAAPLQPPRALATAARPSSLERTENVVAFACGRAVDAHMLLRPLLRRIAADRLAAQGVDLDHDARAPVMLGPWAWALLRPDAAEPVDRRAPGLDPVALTRIVEALEAL
jgi:hypothetical protein